MKLCLGLVIAAALAGCASSSGVLQTGDTYHVTTSAWASLGGAGTARGSAYKQAEATCAKQGKRVELVDQKADAQLTGASVDLAFRCVSP